MKELEQTIESIFPPANWCGVRTLVAVSGGPDSVAALRAMLAIGRKTENWTADDLIVGHVNHGTRGEESDADSRFVQYLANESSLPFYESVPQSDNEPSTSEESLRNFRYDQLLGLATKLGARYIVTGHNFDDQVETILFRILRGTGISGLAGIPRQRLANESVTIIRPLLDLTRDQIVEYLNEIEQDFRVDSSNANLKYTRNFLRKELIPQLKQRFGASVPNSIARLGTQAEEVDQFLNDQLGAFSDAVKNQTSVCLEIDCRQLRGSSPILVRQWLNRIWREQDWPRQSMTYQWWQTITEAIQAESDSVLNLPCSIRFEKKGSSAGFLDLRDEVEHAD